MSFRFYITDLFDGKIKGTDDQDKAKEFAECEDFFVLDSKDGTWLGPGGMAEPVSEV